MLFQTINSFNQYLRSNLAALHLFKLDGFLAVADRLLVIIVCGAWLTIPAYSQYLTIENFAMVQLGGVALTLIIALTANLTKLESAKLEQVESIKQIIRSSLPFALLITLMAIFTRIDAVMIGQILGDSETDRYAMCYRLLDAANMMAALFSGMLLPMFARIITKNNEIRELSGLAAKVLVLPALLGALILAPHAEYVLTVMFPNKTELLSPNTFIALLFSFIASASVFVFGTLLTAKQDLKSLNRYAGIAAVANIVLNLLLIPSRGIEGAAFATLITQGLFATACFAKSYKQFDLKISRPVAVRLALFLSTFSLLFYGGLQFLDKPIVHISFGVVLSFVLVVSTGVLTPKTLKKLSRRNPSDNHTN
jgi:O-antigen/teichoic acid export membrane protein